MATSDRTPAPSVLRQSSDLNPPTRLSNSHPIIPAISTAGSFQRRTVEGARQIRDNISNVIREIQPFVETARNVNNVIREIQPLVDSARNVNAGVQNMSLSGLLNRPTQLEARHASSQDNPGSYVINVDEIIADQNENVPNETENHIHTHASNFMNNAPSNDNNAEEAINAERLQTVLETQQMLGIILKYIPFVLILLAKGIYDFHEGIFILIIMLITFAHANSTIKKEATKRHRRSLYALAIELLYVSACLLFIHFIFDDEIHNFADVLNLVLIRTFSHPLTVWNLLWIVTITDFVLKLITVTIKILLTMLPGKMLVFQKRGKIYLFIEAISQMYRSLATVQPWLYYLLESYQGPEKIVAVFLSAFYMISKGPDLMSKLKLFKNAFLKLLQNVTVGSSPSKEQIQTAGEHCPICHDEYESPVLLHCRHIFCENCVTTWFDREQTCPLCRAKIVDDPSWRDGSTSYFVQIF